MDINQNQQINTFIKGMNTDTSDMLLGSDLYRYAENVRIVTDTDNNSGELHIIEGTTFDEQFSGEEILATDSIRDIGIVITRDGNDQHQYWRICRLQNGSKTPVLLCNDSPLWKEGQTIEDIRKSITTVMRYESPENIKLYIADSTEEHSIMVVNVANETDETAFDVIFPYQRALLPPPIVSISATQGSIISGKVQYAYRLYSKNNPATQLSILSAPLSLYKNEHEGYQSEKRSGRAVDIQINANTAGLDYVQVYRISYQISGQLPVVSLVKDEKITPITILDTGTDIEEISVPEFLLMFTPFIYPKLIESKGDYLFGANMKYSQDIVDLQFETFDATSLSRGNYTENGVLKHHAFDQNNNLQYDEADWEEQQYEIQPGGETYTCNGHGEYICWKYIYEDLDINPQNQGSISNQKSTFRCGETYRFGIKLYDLYGRASSVKWIADIMIPPGANINKETTREPGYINGVLVADGEYKATIRNVGIKFFKTPGSTWPENISGWEIVRCERKLGDRKAITLGIVGFPVHEKRNYSTETEPEDTYLICTPGFFSTDEFTFLNYDNPGQNSRIASTDNSIVMFSSPEVCYQGDDIKDILKSFGGEIYFSSVYHADVPSVSGTKEFTYTHGTGTVRNYEIPYVMSSENKQLSFPIPYEEGAGYKWLSNSPTSEYMHDSLGLEVNVVGTANESTNTFKWLYLNYFGDADKTYGQDEKNLYRTSRFMNYLKPSYVSNSMFSFQRASGEETYKITDVQMIDSPKSSDFAKNEVLLYKNQVVSIGGLQFINWSTPLMLDLNGSRESTMKSLMNNINFDDEGAYGGNATEIRYPIGAGGKTLLLKASENENERIPKTPSDKTDMTAPSITVMNINKAATPYGGYNKTAIDNSSYISFGDYTTGDSIDVYSGDTKNRIFTFHALHYWYDSTYRLVNKMATVYAIPVETDIDIQAQYGKLYGVDGMWDYRVQDTADAFEGYTQDKSAYMYNTVYNATPDIVSWTTAEQLESKLDHFDTRIHYSNVKTNNENIDSWTQFAAANYIDVDSRYGEITDLKLFKDRLMFWQENATGILAVNERVVLNDQNDTQVVLGTGGVLERYDYITTVYGQKKNQHARTISNDSLYWWDGNNKEILMHQLKFDAVPLSTAKNIKNYLNKYDETTTPELAYDNKYKEIIASVVNQGSIVFNELAQQFTGVYTFNPLFDFAINGKLFLTSSDGIYEYNKSNGGAELFENEAAPLVQYTVNANSMYNKVFDIQTLGGRFYGGDDLSDLYFTYKTPLKQESRLNGAETLYTGITNREYDFRLNIPRAGYYDTTKEKWVVEKYGDRMRGKTMQCEIKSGSNNLDFSLQYIVTKFRTSWT